MKTVKWFRKAKFHRIVLVHLGGLFEYVVEKEKLCVVTRNLPQTVVIL